MDRNHYHDDDPMGQSQLNTYIVYIRDAGPFAVTAAWPERHSPIVANQLQHNSCDSLHQVLLNLGLDHGHKGTLCVLSRF